MNGKDDDIRLYKPAIGETPMGIAHVKELTIDELAHIFPRDTDCPCDREKHVDPQCCAAGMCARDDGWDYEPECPTCNGSGIVNPLTAPSDVLCLTSMLCRTCEGTGR